MDIDTELDTDSNPEMDCLLQFHLKPYPDTSGSQLYCNSSWDGLSCWPTTLAGSNAYLPCFSELNGVQYDANNNATLFCNENGSWSEWSNYRSCTPVQLDHDNELIKILWDVKDAATIYYVGYGLSLVALSLALFVFLYFKDLKCFRNTIHTNLMTTYVLIDITWIVTSLLQSSQNTSSAKAACFMVILLTYLMGTNFFWMFVEGLYLYILVVETFSIDKVKYKTYLIIGWGAPAVVAAAWAVIKGAVDQSIDEPLTHQRGCPWQNRDYYDYVFICPVVFVLLINTIFLAKVMWVLITKLRASNTVESDQYRKAAKALLVLIPLLGITYILVLATPTNPTAEVVFTYIQATLLSAQGFIVAVLYCFLNGEVQNSLKHHLDRWRTQSTVGKSLSHSKSTRKTNRQRSEDIKLYSNVAIRDSCSSFTTTMTIVNSQNKSPNANHNAAVQEDMV